MEFGALIPLFYMTLCCTTVTPFVGTALLAYIWFRVKDKQLVKNILFTLLGVELFVFMFPILEAVWFLISIPKTQFNNCPCPFSLADIPMLLAAIFQSGIRLLFPGITLGYLVAFFIVVPITLIVRSVKMKKNSAIPRRVELSDSNGSDSGESEHESN